MTASKQSMLLQTRFYITTLYKFSDSAQENIIGRFKTLPGCGGAKLVYDPNIHIFEIEGLYDVNADELQHSLNALISDYIYETSNEPTAERSWTEIDAAIANYDNRHYKFSLLPHAENFVEWNRDASEMAMLWHPVAPETSLGSILLASEIAVLEKELSFKIQIHIWKRCLVIQSRNATAFTQQQKDGIIDALNTIEEACNHKCHVKHVVHKTSLHVQNLKIGSIQLRLLRDQTPDITIYPSDWMSLKGNLNLSLSTKREVIRATTSGCIKSTYLSSVKNLSRFETTPNLERVATWSKFDRAVEFRDIGAVEQKVIATTERLHVPKGPTTQVSTRVESWMECIEPNSESDNLSEGQISAEATSQHSQNANSYPQTLSLRPSLKFNKTKQTTPAVASSNTSPNLGNDCPGISPNESSNLSNITSLTFSIDRASERSRADSTRGYAAKGAHSRCRPTTGIATNAIPTQQRTPAGRESRLPQYSKTVSDSGIEYNCGSSQTKAGRFAASNMFQLIDIEENNELEIEQDVGSNIPGHESRNTRFAEAQDFDDESETRSRIATGKKKTPYPSVPSLDRWAGAADNMLVEKTTRVLNSNVGRCVEAALLNAASFRGEIELVSEIGQIMLPPSQGFGGESFDCSQINDLLLKVSGFDKISSNFTRGLKICAEDTEIMLLNLFGSGNDIPYSQNVTWEITCTTIHTDAIKIGIDALESPNPALPKLFLNEKAFGALYIHGIDTTYDARWMIKGVSATEELSRLRGVADIVESLYVRLPSRETSRIPLVTGRSGDLFVEMIRLHCSMKYVLPKSSPDEDEIFLELVRVHDLRLRRGDSAVTGNDGLFQGYFPDDPDYVNNGHLWYEIRLGLLHPPKEWAENRDLPVGKSASWKGADLISNKTLLALETYTRRLIDYSKGFGMGKGELHS